MKKFVLVILVAGVGFVAYTQRYRLAALLPGYNPGVPIASLKAPPHVLNTLRYGIEAANSEAKTLVFHFELANCGPCERLDNEVFTTRQWKEYAAKNVKVLDYFFPNQFTSEDVQIVKNMELMKTLCDAEHVSGGFPMAAVVSSDGRILGAREGYGGGGAGSYISWIDGLRKWDSNRPLTPKPLAVVKPETAPATNALAASAVVKPVEPAAVAPVAAAPPPVTPAPTVAAVTPPPVSANLPAPAKPGLESFLTVKAIKVGAHPLAMIHTGLGTETVEVGETMTLETPGGKVAVKCERITKDTVFLQVGEAKEPKELRLQ